MNLEQVKDFIKNSDRETLKEIAHVFNQSINSKIQEEVNQFKNGDNVTIVHRTIDPDRIFEGIRVNKKTVTVKGTTGQFKVSPKLLIKK